MPITEDLPLSQQSVVFLDKLAGWGIYGRTRAEVIARIVDAALIEFVEKGRLSFPTQPRSRPEPPPMQPPPRLVG